MIEGAAEICVLKIGRVDRDDDCYTPSTVVIL